MWTLCVKPKVCDGGPAFRIVVRQGWRIEDRSIEAPTTLYATDLAVERIRAARAAIDKSATGTVLVARTEGLLIDGKAVTAAIDRLVGELHRFAALTGAPIVPVFVARTGHRRYNVVASAPIQLDRSASGADLDAAAQELASRLEAFVRTRPTQWFHFRSE